MGKYVKNCLKWEIVLKINITSGYENSNRPTVLMSDFGGKTNWNFDISNVTNSHISPTMIINGTYYIFILVMYWWKIRSKLWSMSMYTAKYFIFFIWFQNHSKVCIKKSTRTSNTVQNDNVQSIGNQKYN